MDWVQSMALNKYTVGKRYGRALFELAEEEQVLDSVFQDVLELREIYDAVPELATVLSNPNLAMVEKKKLLTTVLQAMEEVTRNTIFVVVDNHRMFELPFIIEAFEHEYYEAKKILKATVTTVVPLSENQKEQLSTKLKTQFNYATVELSELIDPSILGGVILDTKNQRMDGSVKTRLETIKKALSK